jgi:T-complex protein 1 subunit beta
MTNGTIGDMWELGIREAYKSKLQVYLSANIETSSFINILCFCEIQVLVSAAEAAEMILRVDDIIKCAPRQRDH